eukprot:3077083-Amphidinium_carterae.1
MSTVQYLDSTRSPRTNYIHDLKETKDICTRTSRDTVELHRTSLQRSSTAFMTTWITHQISQTVIKDGMTRMTATTRSMDYLKTMQNKPTIHDKGHKFPRPTKSQYYLHHRRLKSTT